MFNRILTLYKRKGSMYVYVFVFRHGCKSALADRDVRLLNLSVHRAFEEAENASCALQSISLDSFSDAVNNAGADGANSSVLSRRTPFCSYSRARMMGRLKTFHRSPTRKCIQFHYG